MIQDMTFRRIKVWHVSSHGLEGPPEQETDITKDKSQAKDMWAQNAAHQDKGKVGRPTTWSADGLVGPADSILTRGG